MRLFLLATVFTLTAPVLAHSTTYYVGKTGKDSYSCAQVTSAATPKLTISGGLRCLEAGDTLVIKAGTYTEFFDAGQIPSGTSWGAPVTLRAAADETVVIRPDSGGRNGDVLSLSSMSKYIPQYIIFDGLTFDGSRAPTQVVRAAGSAHHIRFVNGTLRNSPGNCVFIQHATTRYIEFINMAIHGCGQSNQHHGIYVRGQNVLIERSRIYNNSGHGVHVYSRNGNAHHNTVRNNDVYQNGSWGILIGSGENNLAYDNSVWENGSTYKGGGIRIGYNNPVSNQVYNNTVYANATYCIMINSGTINTTVRDNTCRKNASNLVYDAGSNSVVSNNLTTDAQFAAPPMNLRITNME